MQSENQVTAVLAAAKDAGVSGDEALVAFALGFATASSEASPTSASATKGSRGPVPLPTATRPALPKAELKVKFKAAYPGIVEKLQDDPLVTAPGMPTKVRDWVKRLCDYNAPHGKMNRGMICMQAAHMLGVSHEEGAVLGWCIEMMQAAFLVADDIMDASITRRGQSCWYKQEGIGLNAINDSWILLAAVYRMAFLYFSEKPYFNQVLQILKETEYRTELGQFLDLTSGEAEKEVQPKLFTDETYDAIVKYKTAYYSFYGPVALGMAAAGITDPRAYAEAESILMKVGRYFQIQDDYLDCFGTPEQIGKIGRDIEENKCSWLVVQALKRCSEAQLEVLRANYAQEDSDKVAVVKALYCELGIPELFAKFEEESFNTISKEVKEAKHVPGDVFNFALQAIYKRSK